jgi:hypothetical protein
MPQQQMNFRVSKIFNLSGRARVEAIGEVFNVFNAANPGGFRSRAVVPTTEPPIPSCSNRRPTRATSVARNSASDSSGFVSRSDEGRKGWIGRKGWRGNPPALFVSGPSCFRFSLPALPALRLRRRDHFEVPEVMNLVARHLVNQPID